jgi:glycosyltransferase 2 family protein
MSKEINISRFFSFRRVLIPILLGLGVGAFLIFRNTELEVLSNIRWNRTSFFWLFMALLMVVFRDLGYILRLRILLNKALSWRRSFQVIMLWEFASALTPSIVGGSAVAMFIIHKEKIPLGRASAVVMVTAMLDEIFYLITVPVVLLLVAGYPVFSQHNFVILGTTVSSFALFVAGYLFMLFLTLFISYAIFINPRAIKRFLLKLFHIRMLRKWKHGALTTGNDLITTSAEMKGKSFLFWLKAFTATFFSWTSRFLFVNFLILAFMPVENHLHIYATQMVMWVIMLISPTPGGSGIAEYIFNNFLKVFLVAGLAPVLAVIWRIFSYYIYLIVGSIILPGWLGRVFKKPKFIKKPQED